MNHSLRLPFTLLFFAFTGSAFSQQPADVRDYLGPRFAPSAKATAPIRAAAGHGTGGAEIIRHWNTMAVDASGLDHTPVAIGDPRIFGEQLGPARASRAIAIVHIAIFDAVNA